VSVVAETTATGCVPVPVKLAVSVFTVAPIAVTYLTVSVPVRVPTAVGVK
jgi:hypothetical protein